MIKGRYVGRSWNAAGWLNDWESPRLDPARHPAPQAFWLEIDGQLLASHWQWVDFEQKTEETGLHAIVTLRHEVRPVTVQVHTLLDGTPDPRRLPAGDRKYRLSAGGTWRCLSLERCAQDDATLACAPA